MDVGAIKAAAAASAASYRSFADATRSVLDLLERLMPGCALYLSHLDRTHAVHRIVDTRGGARARAALQPLDAARRLLRPRDGGRARAAALQRRQRRPVYAGSSACSAAPPPAPTSASRSSCRTARASARWRRCRELPDRFRADDEQLFTMLARVLAYELERESNERDLQRLNDSLRDHARGMGAVGRVVAALASGDGRPRPPSAGPPARWRARRSPSCSSRPGASSSRPR